MNKLILLRTFALALLILVFATISAPSFAQISIGVSVGIAPPELPVYVQPLCPGPDYIWTPGYWDWDGDDYYWVPGTWVLAPQPGYLWTPGYWAWRDRGFVFTAGYWGPVVGFYGGVNYGFGYFGRGYEGGRWEHDHFFYNREVNNVNVTIIHNTYNETIVNRSITRVSYNGHGGIDARATAEEERAARERHTGPVAEQNRHAEEARSNRELRASVNHGRPPVAATSRPGDFKGHDAVAASEAGAVHGSASSHDSSSARDRAFHPNDLPRNQRPPAPNTGNQKQDQKFQQQQDKLAAQQDRDRQKLQQKQDQDHARIAQQQADDARRQQMEQRHQQQTEQLQQKHTQQAEKLQNRQQPRNDSSKDKQQR
jgi:WXXGXW repeat (2 copies)